jgi:hypothetical protein
MNRQEAFDTAARGVIGQGGPSIGTTMVELLPNPNASTPEIIVTPVTPCLYRNGKGRRCAAGWLIPDNLYDPKFEGKSAHALLEWSVIPLERDDQGMPDIGYVSRLQGCHDLAAEGCVSDKDFLEKFKVGMRQIAADYGLNAREVE